MWRGRDLVKLCHYSGHWIHLLLEGCRYVSIHHLAKKNTKTQTIGCANVQKVVFFCLKNSPSAKNWRILQDQNNELRFFALSAQKHSFGSHTTRQDMQKGLYFWTVEKSLHSLLC